MIFVLCAMIVLIYGGTVMLLLNLQGKSFSWFGAFTVVTAAVVGCIPAVQVLVVGAVERLRVPWSMPFG